MPAPLETIVQRMIDAGEPESAIASVVQHYKQNSVDLPSGHVSLAGLSPDVAEGFRKAAVGDPGEETPIGKIVRFVKNHPTETGAVLGGIAAVPLTGGASLLPAVAAAGLGGAGGAGVGMIGGALAGSPDLPNTATGVVKKMASEGAAQAAGELVGRGASKVIASGAKRLYQGVLKPTLAARAENPDLVETGLKYALPISKGGEAKADTLVKASKGVADTLVNDAAAVPGAAKIEPRDMVTGIVDPVQEARNLPVARPMMRAIGDYARQFMAEHPRALTLPEAQKMVRTTDDFYNPAYRATIDRGNPVTSGSLAATMGINDEARQLLRSAVPGLREQNAVTSSLAGAREAIGRRAGQLANNSPVGMQHLINAGIGSATGALGGKEKGIGTFLTLEALTHPATASRFAIGASRVPTSLVTGGAQAASPLVEELLSRLLSEDQQQ